MSFVPVSEKGEKDNYNCEFALGKNLGEKFSAKTD